MANYFEECQKCVPPKRHPGCHGTCPDYAESRAKFDADKAKADAGRELKYYTNNKHAKATDGVAKYVKKRPRRYRYK